MQTFTGNWGYRMMALFSLGIGIVCLVFFSTMPVKHPDAGSRIFVGVMLLLGSARGLTALWSLAASFARYEIDERGVTRHSWNGVQQMSWSEMTRAENSGEQDSTLVLMDSRNEKLSIERGMIASERRAELNALLKPRLALVTERQMREISGPKTVYYPKRGAVGAGVFMALVVGAMLVFVSRQPVKPGEGVAMVLCLLFIGGMELWFVYGTIVAYSNTLTITSTGLVEQDAFRTRAIDFADITSIEARTVHGRYSTWELAAIQGRGTKITLSSKMDHYEPVVRYIRDRVH